MKKFKLCQCFADAEIKLTDKHNSEVGNLSDGYRLESRAWLTGDDNFSGEIAYTLFKATELVRGKYKKVTQKVFFRFCPFCGKQMFEEVEE